MKFINSILICKNLWYFSLGNYFFYFIYLQIKITQFRLFILHYYFIKKILFFSFFTQDM